MSILPTATELLVPVRGVEIDQGVVFHGNIPFEEWFIWAQQVLLVSRLNPWLVGDTLNYGEDMYGEDFAQVFAGGLSDQTVQNYRSVCRRVPREVRRVDALSFSHHEIVAKMEPEEQAYWLNLAAEEGYTREELRASVKGQALLTDMEAGVEPPVSLRGLAAQAILALDAGQIESAREVLTEIIIVLEENRYTT
jgi:hypothetical protein